MRCGACDGGTDATVHWKCIVGQVAFMSPFRLPAPPPLLVHPTVVPGIAPARPECRSREKARRRMERNLGDGGMRRCIGSALGMWHSGYPLLSPLALQLEPPIGPAPTRMHVRGEGMIDASISTVWAAAGSGVALAVHGVCGLQVTRSSPPASPPYNCTWLQGPPRP